LGEAWLRRLRDVLCTVRRLGCHIAPDSPGRERLTRTMLQLAETPLDRSLRDSLDRLIRDLGDQWDLLGVDDDARYEVANISAPVFGPGGDVVLAINVNGIGAV